ncbi:MAG TPA: uracil-DNA glycosylase [Candidatus Obscuribacterales bacterium]
METSLKLHELRQEIIACRRCKRLTEYREQVARERRAAYRDCTYWGKPVPGFGDPYARLLIVGLAPAAHGGNRTGRVFTGDGSASFLMRGLYDAGFANQPVSESPDDGLRLTDAYVLAVVRCVPPDNKPLPEETSNCRPFLVRETALLPNVKAVLALGKIAMDGYVDALKLARPGLKRPKFAHAAEYSLAEDLPRLFLSYHPSRQNTQTGRLTQPMLASVLSRIVAFLSAS